MNTHPSVFKTFCTFMGIPPPVVELQFEPLRKWRFDFAWPEHRIALEVEGGIWAGGRHIRPKGFLADMAKYNHAVRLGWGVLRVEPKQLLKLATVQMVKEAMEKRCVKTLRAGDLEKGKKKKGKTLETDPSLGLSHRIEGTTPESKTQNTTIMKLTTENIIHYVLNVMDARQLSDFNAWAKTSYEDLAALLENESEEKILEFYS